MKILIGQHEKGLLYINGRFQRLMEPGRHKISRLFRRIHVTRVNMQIRSVQVSRQELMTSDKVTLRVNLIGRYRVRDPEVAVHEVEDYEAWLYHDLQMALRDAVGALTLDELLSKRGDLGRSVAAEIRGKAEAYGLSIQDVGLKDVTLPGDMKEILNQVIQARKRAEAAQIERREEVAAVRSQVNTAEMLQKNPVLMKLREMELMEKVLAGYNSKIVLGLPARMRKFLDDELS
jgi:regulator of protease activity HflC (stomatin/prohibitin superfamily)